MKSQEIFSIVDSLEREYVDIWEKSCNIESPTSLKKGVDECGRYFADLAEKLGFDVEIFPNDASGDVVCITMNAENTEKPIAFSGHIDTVHPVGSFGSPAVRFDEDKICGPGVADCKGGVVAALMAMHALKIAGFDKRPIMLLLQTDEEVGSTQSGKATINYICQKAKDSVAFFNCEGYTKGSYTLERKGIIRVRFCVNGISCHSSNCYKEGANAIAEAAHKIIELEKYKDGNGITCNCGVISGGTVPNTVPDKCEFSADFRYLTTKDYDTVIDAVKEISEKSFTDGCTCTYEIASHRPAMEYSKANYALLNRINEISVAEGLEELIAKKGNGGSDAAYTTLAGIPTVDSCGIEGGEIHSVKEFAYIKSLAEGAKRLAVTAWWL